VRLKVSRVWSPYVFQIFVVFALIWILSLVAFMSDPIDGTGSRIGQATTMVLTVVAFQFVISSLLPKLPYLTLADKYILVCTFFVSAILLQVGILSWLISHTGYCKDDAPANATCSIRYGVKEDNYVLLVNILIFILFHLLFFLYAKYVVFPREKMKKFYSSESLKDIEGTKDDAELKCNVSEKVKIAGTSIIVYKSMDAYKEKESITESANSLTGIWKTDYGKGTEFIAAYIMINDDHRSLYLRKITGDAKVPSGMVSVRTKTLPNVKSKDHVEAEKKVREDTDDPNGFSWEPMTLLVLNDDHLRGEINGQQYDFKKNLK